MKKITSTASRRLLGALLAATLAAAALPARIEASVALPIRNRIQWLENGGYCGETSLQECALYYGIYASQAYIRGIYDPSQQNDLVEIEEWSVVLPALGLKADTFPTEKTPAPQFKAHAVWIKRHLEARHPVITTCYMAGNTGVTDPVDHIITVSAFIGDDVNKYSDDDTFIFNEHYFTTGGHALRARWAFDTRDMRGNGSIYEFSLQKEINYGLAITGTTNRAPEARPVRVELDQIDEPNLIMETPEAPINFAATVTVSGLTVGKTYVLYRYNDPARVPTSKYAAAPNDGATRFKATNTTQTFPAAIRSDGVAVFRCLPSGK